jgi:hypothetical protein
MALLKDVPRTATVRARGPTETVLAKPRGLLGTARTLRGAEECDVTGASDACYLETQNKLLLHR